MDQERRNWGPRPEPVKGNWTCSQCKGEITELPFNPDPARMDKLQCKECWRKNRPPRRDNRF